MTRGGVKEYIEAIRERYFKASRKEKGQILDEVNKVTGYHRKAAIRLLRRPWKGKAVGRRGRARQYGIEVVAALKGAWEASDRMCSKRLQPFLPELVGVLERHSELSLAGDVRDQLCRMSAATIDRVLKPYRRRGLRRPFSTTKPGSLLKAAIPIRTFADWDDKRPGFLEVDLVAHCGESTEGFYLNTLSTVDVATGWVECQGVWGKGQERVGGAVHQIGQRLPFPFLGLDSDNGSEFINHHLYDYCQRKKITFTRSRPYKKNDSAHVEQKNWTVVRRLVGYDRYSSREALAQLNRVYELVRWYANFFQPVMQLQYKSRNGARVRKVYDTARTPYRRLLESGVLPPERQDILAMHYQRLNPVRLLGRINRALEDLWDMATTTSSHQSSVTSSFEATKRVG
jgi:hypothetical protein|tara:strand:+ start:241 stop:1440 length:1200 start_codon:yes stop_codon:yes gene_type:complete